MYFLIYFIPLFAIYIFSDFLLFQKKVRIVRRLCFSIAGRLKVSLSLINGINDYREMENFITMGQEQ